MTNDDEKRNIAFGCDGICGYTAHTYVCTSQQTQQNTQHNSHDTTQHHTTDLELGPHVALLELREESRIGRPEQADVGNAKEHHGQTLQSEPKCPAAAVRDTYVKHHKQDICLSNH